MSKYFDQWDAALKAAPAVDDTETAEIELEGFKFLGRRPPLMLWIKSGRVPQALMRTMLKASKGEDVEFEPESLGAEEMTSLIALQQDAVLASVVDPKIVMGTPGPGEVSYKDFCEKFPNIVDAIVNWVLSNCPGIPVKTETEATSVEALGRFRQKRPGGVPPWAEPDSANVGGETQQDLRAAG